MLAPIKTAKKMAEKKCKNKEKKLIIY